MEPPEPPAPASPKKATPAKATPAKATPSKAASPSPRKSPGSQFDPPSNVRKASSSGARLTRASFEKRNFVVKTCAEMGEDYASGWMCDRCDTAFKAGEGEPFSHCQ